MSGLFEPSLSVIMKNRSRWLQTVGQHENRSNILSADDQQCGAIFWPVSAVMWRRRRLREIATSVALRRTAPEIHSTTTTSTSADGEPRQVPNEMKSDLYFISEMSSKWTDFSSTTSFCNPRSLGSNVRVNSRDLTTIFFSGWAFNLGQKKKFRNENVEPDPRKWGFEQVEPVQESGWFTPFAEKNSSNQLWRHNLLLKGN